MLQIEALRWLQPHPVRLESGGADVLVQQRPWYVYRILVYGDELRLAFCSGSVQTNSNSSENETEFANEFLAECMHLGFCSWYIYVDFVFQMRKLTENMGKFVGKS